MFCKACGKPLDNLSVFCPNCGKKVKDDDATIGLGRELFIYALSVFLAPFGLYWTVKFIKSSDPVKKRVAYLSLIITVVTVVFSVVTVMKYIKTAQEYINSSQITQYKELGL